MNQLTDSLLLQKVTTTGRQIYPGVNFGIRTADDPYLLPEAMGSDIYQIILVTEGSIILSDTDSRAALLPPQLLCVSYSNPMKTLQITNAKGCSIFFIPQVINYGLFSDSSVPTSDSPTSLQSTRDRAFLAERLLIKPFKQGEISNPFHISVNPILYNRIFDMYVGLRDQFTLQPNNNWPCRGRSYFLELLMLLQNLYAFEKDSQFDLPLPKGDVEIEESIKLLLLHYASRDIRPSDIRGPLGFLQFTTRFKRSTGMNVTSYLRLIRLTVAANLLRNTMLPPTDIALRCGYPGISRFYRDFKKMYAKDPVSYRQSFPDPYG